MDSSEALVAWLQTRFPCSQNALELYQDAAGQESVHPITWYSAFFGVNEQSILELMAYEFQMFMLPPDAYQLLPGAVVSFRQQTENYDGNWVPLCLAGEVLWLVNSNPLEPLPALKSPACRILAAPHIHGRLLMQFKKNADLQSGELALCTDAGMPLRDLGLRPLVVPELQHAHANIIFLHRMNRLLFGVISDAVPEIQKKAWITDLFSNYGFRTILLCLPENEVKELHVHQSLWVKELSTQEVHIFLDHLLHHALEMGVSDIHFSPMNRDHYVVRFRRDGCLVHMGQINQVVYSGIRNRVRILAGQDLGNHLLETSFSYTHQGHCIDFRVASLPTFDGRENLVLRVLDLRLVPSSLEELGFLDLDVEMVREALGTDHGLILVTGTTGSGKTTTLYTMLRSLDLHNYSLQTVEDPVEYTLPQAVQYQVHPDQGLTYERLLKHILRADPDYLMIGEIRDAETALTACSAANTGHVVLTTLHANNSISALLRLLDMGVPASLLPDIVRLVIAQRLLRRICPNCRYKRPVNLAERNLAIQAGQQQVPLMVYQGRGCTICQGTGYSGRFAVTEMLTMTQELSDHLLQGQRWDLQKFPKHTLLYNGISRVFQGLTTFKEVACLQPL